MTDSDGCGLDIFSTLKGAEVKTDCSLYLGSHGYTMHQLCVPVVSVVSRD